MRRIRGSCKALVKVAFFFKSSNRRVDHFRMMVSVVRMNRSSILEMCFFQTSGIVRIDADNTRPLASCLAPARSAPLSFLFYRCRSTYDIEALMRLSAAHPSSAAMARVRCARIAGQPHDIVNRRRVKYNLALFRLSCLNRYRWASLITCAHRHAFPIAHAAALRIRRESCPGRCTSRVIYRTASSTSGNRARQHAPASRRSCVKRRVSVLGRTLVRSAALRLLVRAIISRGAKIAVRFFS